MTRETVKTVIFDFGGVLLRTHNYSPRRQWDERTGLNPGGFEDYIFNGKIGQQAQLGQATWEEVWRDAARKFNLSPAEMTQAQKDFFTGDMLDHNLVEYIRRLKQHFTIGLLSNTWYRDGRSLLLQYGIADAFHFSVTSAEVGTKKPNPRIYQIALERANAKPEEAIFVDDFEENIFAARDLGLQVVFFVDPDAACARLVELTGVE